MFLAVDPEEHPARSSSCKTEGNKRSKLSSFALRCRALGLFATNRSGLHFLFLPLINLRNLQSKAQKKSVRKMEAYGEEKNTWKGCSLIKWIWETSEATRSTDGPPNIFSGMKIQSESGRERFEIIQTSHFIFMGIRFSRRSPRLLAALLALSRTEATARIMWILWVLAIWIRSSSRTGQASLLYMLLVLWTATSCVGNSILARGQQPKRQESSPLASSEQLETGK